MTTKKKIQQQEPEVIVPQETFTMIDPTDLESLLSSLEEELPNDQDEEEFEPIVEDLAEEFMRDKESLDLISRILQRNPGRVTPDVVLEEIRDIINSTGRNANLSTQ